MHSIVGEVDLPLEVEDIELVRSGPYISFFVPVGLENPIQLADHHVVPDVEFASLVKEGPIDVKLHDEGLLGAVLVLAFTLHDGVKLVYLVDDRYAVTAIGQLAWLHNPDVPHGTTDGQSVLLVPFLLADDRLSFFVVSDESLVLWVFGAFFDVESEGNDLEELSIGELVVLLQIVEQSFLVAEIEIVCQVIMYSFLVILLLF